MSAERDRVMAAGGAGIMLPLILELFTTRPDLVMLLDRDEEYGHELIEIVADECTDLDESKSHDDAWTALVAKAIEMGTARLPRKPSSEMS